MLKILIVDDEPDICELIHKLIDWEELELTSLGSSQNGIDAMEIILRQKPDIVITDIQMPGMTGLEMIEKASQQKQHDVLSFHDFSQAPGFSRGVTGYSSNNGYSLNASIPVFFSKFFSLVFLLLLYTTIRHLCQNAKSKHKI